MADWFEDSWIRMAGEMVEEFCDYHNSALPEVAHEVWELTELEYFFDAFIIWNAKTSFELRYKEKFNQRMALFRENIRIGIEDNLKEQHLYDEDDVKPDFAIYLKREELYVNELMKSSSSIFKTITGSIIKNACNSLLNNACKRFVFSRKDLTKILSNWLLDKGVEIQRQLTLE